MAKTGKTKAGDWAGATKSRAAAPTRRSQAERTAATRGRLIEAAITCLDEMGYAATSSTVVAERAGVSRGALFYNFPTKGDFMLAVLDHIYEADMAFYLQNLVGWRFDRDTLLRLGDLIWEAMMGVRGRVAFKILMGGADDPDVGPRLPQHQLRTGEGVARSLRERAGLGPAAARQLAIGVRCYGLAMRGLALQVITRSATEEQLQPEREQLNAQLALVYDVLLPEAQKQDAAAGWTMPASAAAG
ncbi:MAG TPA: TetR/AcrR family transcriptional regulator [Caulobacteraceae bacterium]|nr:TetR/AcrR family transcriptional regulator [Caulobacteraceae bacterium]